MLVSRRNMNSRGPEGQNITFPARRCITTLSVVSRITRDDQFVRRVELIKIRSRVNIAKVLARSMTHTCNLESIFSTSGIYRK